MRAITALLLCAVMTGAHALPARLSRRALREDAPQLILGQPVQEITFKNTCDGQGVDMRTFFDFDGAYDWFSKPVTDVIPGIFVDYFCDNVGQVNYQFEAPDNHVEDPAVQEAIRNGTCLNEQVMLRWPGWEGRGPQSTLSLEWPNGTVYDVYVAVNVEEGEQPAVSIADDGTEETVYLTADFGEECDEGERGCMPWRKVRLDSLKPTVTFVCAKPAAGASKKKASNK